MRQFGLIGFPLSHSFSENYFKEKFEHENISDAVYNIFPLASMEDFVDLCNEYSFSGLNVTIPYKEKVIAFLDELKEDALEAGAVNTIKFSNGRKEGYNTMSMDLNTALSRC